MSKIHKINVNTEVFVQLTEYGKEVLKNAEFRSNHQPDWEGYYKFQLWDLMNLFGEYHRLGGKVPFEGNEIFFSK